MRVPKPFHPPLFLREAEAQRRYSFLSYFVKPSASASGSLPVVQASHHCPSATRQRGPDSSGSLLLRVVYAYRGPAIHHGRRHPVGELLPAQAGHSALRLGSPSASASKRVRIGPRFALLRGEGLLGVTSAAPRSVVSACDALPRTPASSGPSVAGFGIRHIALTPTLLRHTVSVCVDGLSTFVLAFMITAPKVGERHTPPPHQL